MKKLFLTALLVPVMAFAQNYPSPTFNSITLQNPLSPANGGTGTTSTTAFLSGAFASPPTLGSITPAPVNATTLATTGWVEATAIGFVGNGSTNNVAALSALAANASAPHVYWPPGTYQFNSCPGVTFAAPVVWKGAPGSVIKFTCTMPAFPTGVLNTNGTAVYIDGMTFDMSTLSNTVGIATTTFNPFLYLQNSGTGFWVQNNRFVNSPSQTTSLFLNGVQNGWVTGNYFLQTTPSRNANQCISMANSDGNNTAITIAHNSCVNTAMFLDGSGVKVIGNDITGWGYGSGLTLGGTETPSGDGWMEVVGNYTHGSQPWSDANLARPSGIESWLPHANITGNVVVGVSGSAIGLGGLATTIANNDLQNWGTCTDAACSGAIAYGIELDYVSSSYNGSGAQITGNRESNPSSALTVYGYGENNTGITNVAFNGNTFSANGGNFPYSQLRGSSYTGSDVWSAWTPTLSTTGGSGASLSLTSARYNLVGHSMKFTLQMILTFTTAPTTLNFTLPFTPNAGSIANGQETGGGNLVTGLVVGGSNTVNLSTPGAFVSSGETIIVSGQYDIQ